MKSACTFMACAVAALTVACASSSGSRREASQPTPPSVVTGNQLQRMQGQTAFDALRLLPRYSVESIRRPARRFVLFLDGTRISDLEVLKTMQATELFEIRLITPEQSIAGRDIEVVVTTVAGRNKSA